MGLRCGIIPAARVRNPRVEWSKTAGVPTDGELKNGPAEIARVSRDIIESVLCVPSVERGRGYFFVRTTPERITDVQ